MTVYFKQRYNGTTLNRREHTCCKTIHTDDSCIN